MSRGLRRFAAVTVVSMYIVLILGALVTQTGSGEGCGDHWPLCHGRWLPPLELDAIIEYTHRLTSAAGGLFVLVMAIVLWRRMGHRPEIRLLAPAAVFFLVLQGGLGAWAVMAPQSPLVMAMHFGISLLAFSSVLLPYMLMNQLHKGTTHRSIRVSPRLRRWAWGVFVYIIGLIYTGAYVRHTRSDLACLDWPLCNGALIPELSGPVGIQFFHRAAAALGILLVAGLVTVAARERNRRPDIYRGSLLAFITILLQALSGGLVVLTELQLMWTLLHSAIVIVHFGALSYLVLQVTPEVPVASRAAEPARIPAPGHARV